MKGLKVSSYTNVIIIQLIIAYTPFCLYICRNSSARFFRAGAVSPYMPCSKIYKKNIVLLHNAGDLPFHDSSDFHKIEAQFPGSVLTLGQYF